MKLSYIFLFCLLSFQWSVAQEVEKYEFADISVGLSEFLSVVEKKFQIKYSYINDIVRDKKITLSAKKYSLEEIHAKIEGQTNLTIVKIDGRFYSITNEISDNATPSNYLEEIIIGSLLTKGILKTQKNVIIDPQKVDVLPGVTDADLLLTLQQLAGVNSPNETVTGLHVRGSSPDQNLILWDGIKIYHQGHLFGMISGFNPNIDQTVKFHYKGVNSKFGGHQSGVVDIKTSDEISKKINLGLNAIDGDAYIQIPLVKDKLGIQLSGRKSFTEKLQTFSFNQLANKVFQNTNFIDFSDENNFRFQDYFAKINFKPTSKTSLLLSSVAIDNNLQFQTPNNLGVNRQNMKIQNYGFSLNWIQRYSSRFSQNSTAYYSVYNFDYQRRLDFSGTEFDAFKKLNRIVESGAEFNFSYLLYNDTNVDFGYQVHGKDVSHLFNAFNNDFGVVLSFENRYNVTHATYFNIGWNPHDWSVHAGGRYNRYTHINEGVFEPRLLIQKQISSTIALQTSYEIKSQIISQIRESVFNDLSLENFVWILSDKANHPVQRSRQLTAGLIFKDRSWLLDVDFYYRKIRGITSFSFGFQNQFDENIRRGDGFTKGIDFLLQKRAREWRVWLTYSYQDSQNRFDQINNNQYFRINTNINHSINLAFNREWEKFSFAMGWFWHSGKPYSVLDNDGEVTSFNDTILPNYHRLDVSGIYKFQDGMKRNYKIGFSIYNLYNRRRPISKEFERRYQDFSSFSNPVFTLQEYNSLEITPNVFFRIIF